MLNQKLSAYKNRSLHTFIFIITSEDIIFIIAYKMLLFQLKLQWKGEVKKKRALRDDE